MADMDYIRKSVNAGRWSPALLDFWDFPLATHGLQYSFHDSVVRIAGRQFKTPCLIEIDSSLRTIVRFEFDRCAWHARLTDYVVTPKPGSCYILIGDGSTLSRALDSPDANKVYALNVGASGRRSSHVIVEDMDISADDIRGLLSE